MPDLYSTYIVVAIGQSVYAAKTTEAEIKANKGNLNTLAKRKIKSGIYDLTYANVATVSAAKDKEDAISQARRNGLHAPSHEEVRIKAAHKNRDSAVVKQARKLMGEVYILENPGKVTLPETPRHDVAIGKSYAPSPEVRKETRKTIAALTAAFNDSEFGKTLRDAADRFGLSGLFRTTAPCKRTEPAQEKATEAPKPRETKETQEPTKPQECFYLVALVTNAPDKKGMPPLLQPHGIKNLEAFEANRHFHHEETDGTGVVLSVISLTASEARIYDDYKNPHGDQGYVFGQGRVTQDQVALMEQSFRTRVTQHLGSDLFMALSGREGASVAIGVLSCTESDSDLSKETRENWAASLKAQAAAKQAKSAPSGTAAPAPAPGGNR